MTEESAEDELVASALRGDGEAFGVLHARFAPVVHGILLGMVDAHTADDLTQEVFLAAMQRLRSLRDPKAFGGWIAVMARNRGRDHQRLRQRQRRHETDAAADAVGRPSPPSAEAAEALAAIRSLPECYREPLLLRLVEGLTGPEIAARTGLTAGSVRVNLHRGMKMLRTKLEACP